MSFNASFFLSFLLSFLLSILRFFDPMIGGGRSLLRWRQRLVKLRRGHFVPFWEIRSAAQRFCWLNSLILESQRTKIPIVFSDCGFRRLADSGEAAME
jgi:hypothetical protein